MSRVPCVPICKGPPKSGGIPRRSSNYGAAGRSQGQTCPGPGGPQPVGKAKKPKPPPSELPPLSVLRRGEAGKKVVAEKGSKKMMRRNIPQGEDLKTIREIIKGLKDQEITVHEFVGLVAPYTGDNGTLLRTILASELQTFRKLAKNIYDTMTQDVSDVLTNEHIQLSEASKERHAQYSDKMMRAIDEIYEYSPNFDFEKYYTDSEYLEATFPLPKVAESGGEQEQLQLRQEAYHRMMWLHSEGDRLSQENKKIQNRLHELKRRQREEMNIAKQKEQEAEQKRHQLEEAQENLQEKLEVMNKSIEKTMVEQEKSFREQDDVMPSASSSRREVKKAAKAVVRRAENWNVKAAKDIEDKITKEGSGAESSRLSVASSKSKSSVSLRGKGGKGGKGVKSSKYKFQKTAQSKDTSPFHYSPPKSPPQQQQRQTSPFHYSPPKTPPRQPCSPSQPPSRPQGRPSPQTQTTRVTTSSTSVQQGPSREQAHGRARGPQDSWGGFY